MSNVAGAEFDFLEQSAATVAPRLLGCELVRELEGHNLRNSPLKLIVREALPSERIIQTRRIGITQAKDVPWRFYIADNSFVSKK